MPVTLKIEKKGSMKPLQKKDPEWIPMIQNFPSFLPEITESFSLLFYNDNFFDEVRETLMIPNQEKDTLRKE